MDIFSTKTYDYELPQELIAQFPLEPRDSSKLLVFNKQQSSIEHKIFRDITDYFKKGDVLVLNNTRVLPARLFGEKQDTKAKIEILLLKRLNNTDWEVLAKPGKRCKNGTIIVFNDQLKLEVIEDTTDFNGKIVRFIFDGVFENIIEKIGSMPLPHYIHEKLDDQERYQTVYSKQSGSSAAPTAGLHFTPELLQKLIDKGVIITYVLLHVGLGTFRPVSDENIKNHDMHTEYYEVSKQSADIINLAKKEGRRVIAVGTTSVRTLESAASKKGIIQNKTDNTNIFIYPGYEFKIVDGIITNFHLPQSTLIMLVSAFIGIENTLNIYNTAVKEKYRFFSFGDANLLI